MHILILWCFNVVVAPAPYPLTGPPITDEVHYAVPPTIVAPEFSSLAACEIAAAAVIAKMRKQAEPAQLIIGYHCAKKA